VAVIGLAVYAYYGQREPVAPATEPIERVNVPEPIGEPPRRPAASMIPAPEPDPAVTLPPLEESDEAVQGWLAERFGRETIDSLLKPERIVRQFVVTVDNLPSPEVALRQRPVEAPGGELLTSGLAEDGTLAIAPENYERYAPMVAAVEKIDPAELVATYRHMYPLLQQAYEDLGYPDRPFNSRLVEVVDHLLATPEIDQPVKLVQPKVMYEFADKELEDLSAGQKTLLRMGPENAAIVKAKLRELRAELVAQAFEPERGPRLEVSEEQRAGPDRAPRDQPEIELPEPPQQPAPQ
jgi:hypothetical protein